MHDTIYICTFRAFILCKLNAVGSGSVYVFINHNYNILPTVPGLLYILKYIINCDLCFQKCNKNRIEMINSHHHILTTVKADFDTRFSIFKIENTISILHDFIMIYYNLKINHFKLEIEQNRIIMTHH